MGYFKINQNILHEKQVHTVSVDSVDFMESKVDAIKKLPLLNTRKELKRLIGMISYYHKFIPNLGEAMTPLTEISGASNEPLLYLLTARSKLIIIR